MHKNYMIASKYKLDNKELESIMIPLIDKGFIDFYDPENFEGIECNQINMKVDKEVAKDYLTNRCSVIIDNNDYDYIYEKYKIEENPNKPGYYKEVLQDKWTNFLNKIFEDEEYNWCTLFDVHV